MLTFPPRSAEKIKRQIHGGAAPANVLLYIGVKRPVAYVHLRGQYQEQHQNFQIPKSQTQPQIIEGKVHGVRQTELSAASDLAPLRFDQFRQRPLNRVASITQVRHPGKDKVNVVLRHKQAAEIAVGVQAQSLARLLHIRQKIEVQQAQIRPQVL